MSGHRSPACLVIRRLPTPEAAQGWRSLTPRLAAALALGALAACDQPEAQTAPASPPPRVTVSEPLRRAVTEWDEYSGRFAAVAHVEVRARVGGAVTEVHFRDGQSVRRGDLLFTIDPRPYQAALAEAQGRLAEARARLDLAQRELVRANELRRSQDVPEAVVDQRAEMVRAGNAAVAVAEARLRRAQLDLDWTRVESPVTGRIGRHLVSPGNIISGGEAASTLLAVVVSADPIDFYFDVDQSAYLRYQRLVREGGLPRRARPRRRSCWRSATIRRSATAAG
jgi:RND family efflux transporter MFP subunit